MPTVSQLFISYSHDSPEHKGRVLALAEQLRADGIDAMLDQFHPAPPEGWPLWMEKQIRDAEFVLLVCTETYLRRVMKEEPRGKGMGVTWESTIINSYLFESGVVNEKFIPVVLAEAGVEFIPRSLRPTTYYDVSAESGYNLLYRRLTHQPQTPAGVLGARRVLPPLPRPSTSLHFPPTALAPNLVHPYALQCNFTGRRQERQELTWWLTRDDHSICEIVAMGGMGKSALTWYWLTHDVLGASETELVGVMWWSFYESESSFASFIDDALKYVSGQAIDAIMFPATYDRTQELRKRLQNQRVLFILDGFERQLRAYARLDAAYLHEYVGDPSREARACVDPSAARWLKDIASGTTRAKVLLTSRLPVSDLEDRAGDPLAGALRRELKALARDDAVIFVRAQGVTKGTDTEIAHVCEEYGNHPLSLRLVSGLVARDARMPGDIRSAPRHDVHNELVQRQHHILEQSYNALPKRERALISRIAAFRNPMDYEALCLFNTLNSEPRFNAALDDLQVRGLLERDLEHNRYDLHPIVRHYCYDRLNDKSGIHTRLREYFAAVPTPQEDAVRNIEDLSAVIELYHHTVCSERYDEACDLFYDRLWQLLFYRFGAYDLSLELLRALFPDGEDQPPRLMHKKTQAWALNELANSYSQVGQIGRAIPLFADYIAISVDRHDKVEQITGLKNIAVQQMHFGDLTSAVGNLKRAMELASEVKHEVKEADSHLELGRLLAVLGAFAEAYAECRKGQLVFDQIGPARTNWVSVGPAYLAWTALLAGDLQTALKAAHQARVSADDVARRMYPHERDFVRAEWLLGAVLLKEGTDLKASALHLEDALTRCRRINLAELEPSILVWSARWQWERGNRQEAIGRAKEALTIADRCHYRLNQAEIHNFLARLALETGDDPTARQHAEIAKERAWCDGPPNCYKPALDEAERMLKQLAVTGPEN